MPPRPRALPSALPPILPKRAANIGAEVEDAVDAFLGALPNRPDYYEDGGFRLEGSDDIARIQTLLKTIQHHIEQDVVAQGLYTLGLLYWGIRMPNRTWFGRINRRKQKVLRRGLCAYLKAPEALIAIVAIVNPIHSPPELWRYLSSLLTDFVLWLAKQDHNHGEGIQIQRYDPLPPLDTADQNCTAEGC